MSRRTYVHLKCDRCANKEQIPVLYDNVTSVEWPPGWVCVTVNSLHIGHEEEHVLCPEHATEAARFLGFGTLDDMEKTFETSRDIIDKDRSQVIMEQIFGSTVPIAITSDGEAHLVREDDYPDHPDDVYNPFGLHDDIDDSDYIDELDESKDPDGEPDPDLN